MANWYALKSIATGNIASYSSDDSAGFVLAPPGFTMLGPYATLQAAQVANQPVVLSAQQQAIAALQAKPAATWTLQDVATWLQNR